MFILLSMNVCQLKIQKLIILKEMQNCLAKQWRVNLQYNYCSWSEDLKSLETLLKFKAKV